MRGDLLSLARLTGALVAKCANLMASHRVMAPVMLEVRVLVAVVVIVVGDVVDVERLVLVSWVRAQRAARLVMSGNHGHAASHSARLVHHLRAEIRLGRSIALCLFETFCRSFNILFTLQLQVTALGQTRAEALRVLQGGNGRHIFLKWLFWGFLWFGLCNGLELLVCAHAGR